MVSVVIEYLSNNWLAITSIITALGVFLGPYISHRLEERQKNRENHLSELKRNVLEPLLPIVQRHLYALDKKVSNLTVTWETVAKEGKGHTNHRQYTDLAEIQIPPPFPPFHTNDVIMGLTVNSKLLLDLEQNHFQDRIKEWVSFRNSFQEYNYRCLEVAKRIRKEISDKLPFLNELQTAAYAVYVYDWLIGISRSPIDYKFDGTDDRGKYGVPTCKHHLSKVYEVDYPKIMEVIDSLIGRLDYVDGLREEAERLKEDAQKVKDDLEYLLSVLCLEGQCTYAKGGLLPFGM